MNKYNFLLVFAAMAFVSTACNYSAGVKKDLRTGLSLQYKGFRVRNVFLAGPGNNAMTDNKVSLNTEIALVMLGMENYGLKDGKVFPGMTLTVTDQQGAKIIDANDLFAGLDGAPPAHASELRGDISIGKPMIVGGTYHVKVHVWDKVNKDNILDAEADIIVSK